MAIANNLGDLVDKFVGSEGTAQDLAKLGFDGIAKLVADMCDESGQPIDDIDIYGNLMFANDIAANLLAWAEHEIETDELIELTPGLTTRQN